MHVWDFAFGILIFGFSGFWIFGIFGLWIFGFGISDFRFRVLADSGFLILVFGFWILNLGFGIWDLGLRISDFGFQMVLLSARFDSLRISVRADFFVHVVVRGSGVRISSACSGRKRPDGPDFSGRFGPSPGLPGRLPGLPGRVPGLSFTSEFPVWISGGPDVRGSDLRLAERQKQSKELKRKLPEPKLRAEGARAKGSAP